MPNYRVDNRDQHYPEVVETDEPVNGYSVWATIDEATAEIVTNAESVIAHWKFVTRDVKLKARKLKAELKRQNNEVKS